jgi:glycosyltransferase involved in cell wall biosynthesis
MTTDAVGGVWTYSLELAAALAPRGAEVHLATMGPEPGHSRLQEIERSAAVAGLHVSRFALEWEPEPWEDVAAAGEWLLSLEGEIEPDLIHLNGYAHGALAWRAPAVSVAHSDVLSWWAAVKRKPLPPSWDRYRHALTAGLRAVDAVCTPTHAALLELRRHVEFPAPAFVIHNGRSFLSPDVPKEPFVLGVGRYWDEAKNLTALERVERRVPWPVVLAGKGTVHGHRDPTGITTMMARAAVFAAPARYEPFGLAILEAALSGCALVLGDIASLRELWEDAALFVDPDDDNELASAIQLLATRQDLLVDLARRAGERAVGYNPATMANGYIELYRRALRARAQAVHA